LPTCWAVDSAPATDPAVAGSAWLSTVVVSGVMHSPCPAPGEIADRYQDAHGLDGPFRGAVMAVILNRW
jgi:hypothetical protein